MNKDIYLKVIEESKKIAEENKKIGIINLSENVLSLLRQEIKKEFEAYILVNWSNRFKKSYSYLIVKINPKKYNEIVFKEILK